MTRDDADKFWELLRPWLELYGRTLSAAAMSVYFQAMAEFSVEQVRDALNAGDWKYFPMPADLRRQIQGTPDDAAAQAWEALHSAYKKTGGWESVLFIDGSIVKLIETLFGSWPRCAEVLATLTPEMTRSKQKEFTEAWRRAHREGWTFAPGYLAGTCETTNKTTVGNWTRGNGVALFKQRVWIQAPHNSRWVMAEYDYRGAGLITSISELLGRAPLLPPLPAAQARQLTDGEKPLSPEENEKLAAEFRQGLEDWMSGKRITPPEGFEETNLPPPGPKLNPEEVEDRRETLRRQAEAIKEAEV